MRGGNLHRQLFLGIKNKLSLHSQRKWLKVQRKEILQHGGKPLMDKYGSVFGMLRNMAPDLAWDPFEEGKYPSKHWDNPRNTTEFVNKLKQRYNIQHDSDWKKITWKQIEKHGGSSLRHKHTSLLTLLQAAYPEKQINPLLVCKKLPDNYWKDRNNRQLFGEYVKTQCNIKSPSEWRKVTHKDIVSLGGQSLLKLYKSTEELIRQEFCTNSEESVLTMRSRKPFGYWNDENIRATMDAVGKEIGIQTLDDWNHVPLKTVKKYCGARAFLRRKSSFFELLKDIYPHHNWKEDNFSRYPAKYWKKRENHQKFLRQFAKKYSLTSPEHWRNISYQQIVEEKGALVVRSYTSMFEMLQIHFPEYHWKVEDRKESPKNYWKDKKQELLQKVRDKYAIKDMEDWYRISFANLASLRALSFVKRHGGLGKILAEEYPDYPWNMELFKNRRKKSRQREMFIRLQELFPPGEEIIEEFRDPQILRKTGLGLEFDVYFPRLKLAFEYQGEHHYAENAMYGPVELYQERDEEKVAICSKHNIALVIVSFLWDGTLQQLQYFINSQLQPETLQRLRNHAPNL